MQDEHVLLNLIDFAPNNHLKELKTLVDAFRNKLQQIRESIRKYRRNGRQFHGYIPAEYYHSIDFALMAIEFNPKISIGFSDQVWKCRGFQLALMRRDPTLLLTRTVLISNREAVRMAISQPGFGYLLKSLNPEMWKDMELWNIAKRNGMQDGEYMLWCGNWRALDIHEPEERKIVIKNLERNGDEFEIFTHMHADRELALTAIKDDPSAIYFVSDELKRNREFIMEAIQSRVGKGLKQMDRLPEYWENDRELVLEIAKQSYSLLKFTEYDWRSDDEFVMELIRSKSIILNDIPDRFKTERDLVLKLVKHCGIALQLLDLEMRNDREIVKEAIKDTPTSYQFASDLLKYDREIIDTALQGSCDIIHIIPSELQNDSNILLQALKSGLDYKKYIPYELKTDRNFILQACEIGKIPYSCIPIEFISEFEIIATFIKHMNGLIFKYEDLPEEIQNNKDLLLKLIEFVSPKIILLLPPLLWKDTEFLLEYVKLNGDILLFLDGSFCSFAFLENAAKINRHAVGKHINAIKQPPHSSEIIRSLAENYGFYFYKENYESLKRQTAHELRMKFAYPDLQDFHSFLL